jgi:RNA-binding protein PNO1
MPAPTALQRAPEALAENFDMAMTDAVSVPLPAEDDAPLVDMDTTAAPVQDSTQSSEVTDAPTTDESGRPVFPKSGHIPLAFKRERRNVAVPPHRMSP